MDLDSVPTQALEGNLHRFVLFRLLFSARFYYPVFTILFLDYGLTLEQFSLLNLVWALTIVGAEVPSGALADILGRKRLLVFAAGLMVLEMALLVFVPIGASPLLFTVFLLNRVFSGLAEAAASGADEALAYDSLKALGREDDWVHLLERTSRIVSIGFFITMITGALVYDAELINGLLGRLNPEWVLDPVMVIRLPVVLTLITACVALSSTLGMTNYEPSRTGKTESTDPSATLLHKIVGPFRQIMAAGRWTVGHQFILLVILAALVLDSTARQFVILAGEYYRLIDISPAWFGIIGASMSLVGVASARLSSHLVTHHAPLHNFFLLAAMLLFGLTGLLFMVPRYGVVFAIPVFSIMSLVSFQSSYYINREVDSEHRATVLSFRGLALNLGLGTASLFYTGLIAALKSTHATTEDPLLLRENVFVDALWAFPIYFVVLLILLMTLGRALLKDCAALPGKPQKSV